MIFYWRFIVNMVLSCIVSQTKRDIGWKSWLFSSAFDALINGDPVGISPKHFLWKTTLMELPGGKKVWRYIYIFYSFGTIGYTNVTYIRTDGHRAMAWARCLDWYIALSRKRYKIEPYLRQYKIICDIGLMDVYPFTELRIALRGKNHRLGRYGTWSDFIDR